MIRRKQPNKGRKRSAVQNLAAQPESETRYVCRCVDCNMQSIDSERSRDARVWCLSHAHFTSHDRFQMVAFQSVVVRTATTPTPSAT